MQRVKHPNLFQAKIQNEVELKTFLDLFEANLEEVAAAHSEVSFNQYIGLPSPSALSQIELAFEQLLVGTKYQQLVRDWLPRVNDPQLKRRLTLLNRLFIETAIIREPAIYEMRSRLNAQLLRFVPVVGEQRLSRSEVNQILRTQPDRKFRQQVFEQALSPLATTLAPQVVELMRLRNRAAQNLGYTDFATLQLELLGLKSAQLFQLFDELEAFSDVTYQAFLAKSSTKAGIGSLQSWDLSWLAEREGSLAATLFPRERLLDLVKQFLADFGLNLAALPIQVIQQDVPFGGLCYTIRIPNDIRILTNPKDGYPYFRTLLHEFGHALHVAFCQQSYYSLKYEAAVFNEGMAEVLAYFTHYPEWLQQHLGLDQAEVELYQSGNLFKRLLKLRTLLAQARFEIEAYQNPEQDLELLNARLESRYLQVPLNLTPRWAASTFPITHPVYRQNYVLAEIIAAQTHTTLQQRFGSFWHLQSETRQKIFKFLVENYYAPAASLDWTEKLERATGQPLNLNALFDQLRPKLPID